MNFAIARNEHSAQRDMSQMHTYRTVGDNLHACLSWAFGRLPAPYQAVLEQHLSGTLSVEIRVLPDGWSACADIATGRRLLFSPWGAGLPGYVLCHVCAEEWLHIYQHASGIWFPTRGGYERHVDGLLDALGFSKRASWDFHASMTSTRKISDEEWRAIQERNRYAMP